MSATEFKYQRLIQFYETDAMGIVHHANYILMMEEARLHFLRLLFAESGDPEGDLLGDVNYPLVSCHVDYKKPLQFNDELVINYRVSTEKARLIFEYEFATKAFPNPLAFGKTVHVAFDMKNKRAIKLPESVLAFLQAQGTS